MFCGGKSKSDKKNTEINRYLEKEKERLNDEVKLLLLGAGESGKSTIAKQLKIIHANGFTEDELLTYKTIVYSNTIVAMRNIIKASETLKIPLAPELDGAIQILNFCDPSNLGQKEGRAIQELWKADCIQEIYKRQSEYQLYDSAAYYFDNIERIVQPNYRPNVDDVIHTRAKTNGIIQTDFVIEKTKFKLVDVGGQRSERKKWLHCFEDVTCVIFCVALNEYDLKLYEDNQTNRMQESLKLFRTICNSNWLKDVSMILFFNKSDLFKEKIKTVDLKCCFEDYTGGCDYNNALNFIKDKFLAENENPKKLIYTHVTTAIDTNNIKFVFDSVKDTVLHQVLDLNY